MKRQFLIIFSLLILIPVALQATEFSSSNSTDNLFSDEPEFLDVDDAFVISTDILDNEIIVRWQIAEGYYLYNHRFGFEASDAELGEANIPQGLEKTDEYFGDVIVYYNHVEITVPFKTESDRFVLTLKYQGCADAGLCYTPATRYLTYEKNADSEYILTSGIEKKIPGVATSATSGLTDKPVNSNQSFSDFQGQSQSLKSILANGNLIWTLLAFLGAGLLLTFTPCVLPMIPILSGIIAGQGKGMTAGRAFRLSFVYVQAMAITYAFLGILVARAGSSLSGYLQSPLILTVVAILFIVLAMSMFGVFEIKLPGFVTNSVQGISGKQKGGNYLGVAAMGVISTLIVSPCTSAPLTAALLYIAQSGNELLGGLSLYFLGLGMGVPLLIIGISEGKLLPKAGSWMESVKQLFGFLMLGLAIYITDHLLPGPLVLFLWSVLLIIAATVLGAFESSETALQRLRKALALIVFLIGVIYLVGSAMGNNRLLKPLAGFSSTQNHSEGGIVFQKFSGLEELNAFLKEAKSSGRPVMVDFFAEWCVACYEFEDYTFSDKAVQSYLKQKNLLLLQADVTENNEQDLALQQSLDILGLPSILFYNSEGIELKNARATGFEDADVFLARLKSIYK